MRKSYDTFLQSEVSADLAAKSGGFEPYRYECSHCGEEVSLAAAGSVSRVAYFRHRRGNNDVECEQYLGQYGAIDTDYRSRKSRNERAEFYFESGSKLFSLGLCFSENEIAAYEEAVASFELRASALEQAFYAVRINARNFTSDIPRIIPIEKFSFSYFLSNTLNNIKRKYDVLKKDGTPTFFKIQGDNTSFRAKLVRSTIIYTDVPYFVVSQAQYSFSQDHCLPSDIEVADTFRFETMGRRFLGKVLIIRNKTAEIDSLIASWGYQLEASETLTLLWPPAIQNNAVSVIHSDYAYLFSSFKLEPHGNINVRLGDVKIIGDGVSKVSIGSRVKVYRKNAEIVINKEERLQANYDALPIEEVNTSAYEVLDDGMYYLFNRSGATALGQGQKISLTPGSFIKHYNYGYLSGIVYPVAQHQLTDKALLNDILTHYKGTEPLSLDTFNVHELSETASQYIEECISSGMVNSVAKRFIEGGRL